jgi:hypothetical protein
MLLFKIFIENKIELKDVKNVNKEKKKPILCTKKKKI